MVPVQQLIPRTKVGSNTILKEAAFAPSTVSMISKRLRSTSGSKYPSKVFARYLMPFSASSTPLKSARYFSIDSFAQPSFSSSSATPSSPILSILSKIINTVSKSSSANPLYAAIAFKIRRSLMRISKFLNPSFPIVVVVAKISSISARFVGSPIISMSHCIN